MAPWGPNGAMGPMGSMGPYGPIWAHWAHGLLRWGTSRRELKVSSGLAPRNHYFNEKLRVSYREFRNSLTSEKRCNLSYTPDFEYFLSGNRFAQTQLWDVTAHAAHVRWHPTAVAAVLHMCSDLPQLWLLCVCIGIRIALHEIERDLDSDPIISKNNT